MSLIIATGFIFTAVSCFILGAIYQQDVSFQGIKNLAGVNTNVLQSRNEICSALSLFRNPEKSTGENLSDSGDSGDSQKSVLNQINQVLKEWGTLILQDFYYNDEVEVERPIYSNLEEIMKYGFPGNDEIYIYEHFVLSYDRRNRCPHWVCEHLVSKNLSEDSDDDEEFSLEDDNRIPSIFRPTLNDYVGSNFEPGFFVAACNLKSEKKTQYCVHSLSSTSPQIKGLKSQMWRRLQKYIYELVKKFGSVYVYTGPLYMPRRLDYRNWFVHYKVLGVNTTAVPTHFFKVIIIDCDSKDTPPYMEGYALPNAPIGEDNALEDFMCHIGDIEHFAGLNFYEGFRRITNISNEID